MSQRTSKTNGPSKRAAQGHSRRPRSKGASRPTPKRKALTALQVVRLIGIALLATIPLDFYLLQHNLEFEKSELTSIQIFGALLSILLVLLCFLRRIVQVMQNLVIRGQLYGKSRFAGYLIVIVLGIIPVLMFVQQWNITTNFKSALIALVGIIVAVVQLYQFLSELLRNFRLENRQNLAERIAQGRFFATILGIVICRIICVLVALSLPHDNYQRYYYGSTFIILLYLGLFLLHELSLKLEITGLSHHEIRNLIRKAEIKNKELQSSKKRRAKKR